MQHSYIDRYVDLDSFVHRIEPRIKIIISFILVLSIVLTPKEILPVFILYSSILLVFLLSSRIPISYILKKSLVIIPFVILISLFIPFMQKVDGVILFWSIVIKSFLSALTMILLASSTKITTLLNALERLKLPRIFIMILSFMYRYSFVLVDEAQRMLRAKESRTFEKRGRRMTIKTLSNIVGVLFIRSYERAERVYLAMCSRGFNNEYHRDKKS